MEGNAELDKMCKEIDEKVAEEHTVFISQKMAGIATAVDALRSLGAQVSVNISMTDETEAKNSIEIGPADCRVKIYYKDLADLKVKLKEAQEAKIEANACGLMAVPKVKGA